MPPLTAPPDELAALDGGHAWVDLSALRMVRVGGRDARAWLHDLVTTDVASLGPGDSRRTLLLDPAGHIRADLHVASDGDGFWLLQPSDQGEDVGGALARYVLSSDVWLQDRSGSARLIALPGRPDEPAVTGFHPSVLGEGVDRLSDLGEGIAPPQRPGPGRPRRRGGVAHPARGRAHGARLRPDVDPCRGRVCRR